MLVRTHIQGQDYPKKKIRSEKASTQSLHKADSKLKVFSFVFSLFQSGKQIHVQT